MSVECVNRLSRKDDLLQIEIVDVHPTIEVYSKNLRKTYRPRNDVHNAPRVGQGPAVCGRKKRAESELGREGIVCGTASQRRQRRNRLCAIAPLGIRVCSP